MHDLGIVALVVGAGLVVYFARCAIWPYGPCRYPWCKRGRNAGSNERMWGRCPICHGSGERLRFGARLLRRGKGHEE